MITKKQIIDGYRAFLGRDPETPEIIAFHKRSSRDLNRFHASLIASREFALDRGMGAVVTAFHEVFYQPFQRVDHEVAADQRARMLDRIRSQWTRLGEEEPLWSVLSHEDFRSENLNPEALAIFWESGRVWADMIDAFTARTETAAGGVCLELGCGVGRITRHLAERFDEVIAVDISPGNLALCRTYMAEAGVENVRTVQTSGIEDFAALPRFDFFYSMIVLQHNPPPIQKAILDGLFERLNPGGGVLFQIPTSISGYAFDAETYLDSEHGDMEMHGLPRHVVLSLMQQHDIEVLDMVPDWFSGGLGSFTFYGVKRLQPEPEPVEEIVPEPVAETVPAPTPHHPFGGVVGRALRKLGLRAVRP